MFWAILLTVCISARVVQAQGLIAGSPEQETTVYATLRAAGDIHESPPFIFLRTASWRPKNLSLAGDLPAARIESFLAWEAAEPIPVITLLPHLGRPQIDSTPDEDSSRWATLRETYGDSVRIVVLSRVGFDSTLTHAVVFVSEECGGRCGGKTMRFTLRKGDSGWEIASRTTLIE